MAEEIDIQVQEVQRVPNKLDSKRATPRHIIIKMSKIKGKKKIFLKKDYIYLLLERGRRMGGKV